MLNEYPDVMRVRDVQSILGVGKTRVYKLLHSGAIQYITIGRMIRVLKPSLIDYLASLSYNDIESDAD